MGTNGELEACDDIPVWEYAKRHVRYNLRPLIYMDGKYLWGPYSVRRSGIIWSNIISNQCLPTDIQSPSVSTVVDKIKNDMEIALVDKTKEILSRHMPPVERDVFLHKRDKAGGHPKELGDYDVLAFNPKRNLVIYIEDKDLLPGYCLKDMKRLREKIFGRDNSARSDLKKVEDRAVYLKKNIKKVARILGWNLSNSQSTHIVTCFVSRHSYWWTKYPPVSTDVNFIRIELLNDFIKEIIEIKKGGEGEY